MNRFVLALLLLLLLAPLALGQSVTIPAEVRVPVGRLAAVTVVFDGEDFRYAAPADMDCFREYHPDPKTVRLRLIGYAPGKYQLFAVACKGGKLSEFAVCTVVVGEPTPPPTPPGPTPGPTPPGPTPGPAPIPLEGLRVLIIYESAELAKIPASQHAVLNGEKVRGYLDSKCAVGADGKTKEWRIWDKDASVINEAKHWQDAWARPRGPAMPWVIISNGKDGYEGPLPVAVEEMMLLLKKFGGN